MIQAPYISNAFAYKLNKNSEPLKFQLVISTPLDAEVISNMYNRGSEIRIGERSLVDLVKLGEMEYDVIFGMNWLSSCHTQVDYHEKRTTFRMNGTPEFIYEGNQHRQNIPIISAIKATNLLR